MGFSLYNKYKFCTHAIIFLAFTFTYLFVMFLKITVYTQLFLRTFFAIFQRRSIKSGIDGYSSLRVSYIQTFFLICNNFFFLFRSIFENYPSSKLIILTQNHINIPFICTKIRSNIEMLTFQKCKVYRINIGAIFPFH